jgi:hypothetical protein
LAQKQVYQKDPALGRRPLSDIFISRTSSQGGESQFASLQSFYADHAARFARPEVT